MARTFLKEHKGVRIDVDEEGRFHATVRRVEISRKDLRSVEREIEQAIPKRTGDWPGQLIVQVNKGDYGTKVEVWPPVRVVAVRKSTSRGRRAGDEMILDSGIEVRHGNYYRYEEAAHERLLILAEQINAVRTEMSTILGRLGSYNTWQAEHDMTAWAENVQATTEVS